MVENAEQSSVRTIKMPVLSKNNSATQNKKLDH